MQLPLTVSCFSKIQIGFTFLVPAHLGSPGKELFNGCVYTHPVIVVIYVATRLANKDEYNISFRFKILYFILEL